MKSPRTGEELADIMEVVEALAHCVEGVSHNELDEIKRRKIRERGGFMRGHVMFAYPASPETDKGTNDKLDSIRKEGGTDGS